MLDTGRLALRRGLTALARLQGRTTHEDASGRTGPRIAVIGNCQARGVARSLEVLLPDARVRLVSMGRLGKEQRSLEAFAKSLRDCDHVFSQPFATGYFPDGGSADLVDILPQIRLFPAIVFTAFHPDMVYVGHLGSGPNAGLVPSPLHTYHSAIILFGYLRGLSAARIASLFREEIFSALGYLDGWRCAAEDLAASSRAIGFDLGPDLARWSRRGAFMHGINHPTLPVLADIAARLAREARLVPIDLAVDGYMTDALLDEVVWPVYPPIAAAYGLAGSYTFKRRAQPKSPPSVLDLNGFVTESLALYRTLSTARLSCLRTDHWAAAPETCRLFDEA